MPELRLHTKPKAQDVIRTAAFIIIMLSLHFLLLLLLPLQDILRETKTLRIKESWVVKTKAQQQQQHFCVILVIAKKHIIRELVC